MEFYGTKKVGLQYFGNQDLNRPCLVISQEKNHIKCRNEMTTNPEPS